jgi:hypothetical protein
MMRMWMPKYMSKRVGRQTERDKTTLPARAASCAVLIWTARCSSRAAEPDKSHTYISSKVRQNGNGARRIWSWVGFRLVGRVESLENAGFTLESLSLSSR